MNLCTTCIARVGADREGQHTCPVAHEIAKSAEVVEEAVEWHWYATACPYYIPRAAIPSSISGAIVLDAIGHLDLAEEYVEQQDNYEDGYQAAMDARAILLVAVDEVQEADHGSNEAEAEEAADN